MGRGGRPKSHNGRSRRLPSSGGDRSHEMGRSPRLLCSGSGISRGMGRSHLLGREPGEEGGLDALSLREGCGRGVFLSLGRSNASLTLPVSPCQFSEGRGGSLKPMACGGGVAVQGGELHEEGLPHVRVRPLPDQVRFCRRRSSREDRRIRARGRGLPPPCGGTPAPWRPYAQG